GAVGGHRGRAVPGRVGHQGVGQDGRVNVGGRRQRAADLRPLVAGGGTVHRHVHIVHGRDGTSDLDGGAAGGAVAGLVGKLVRAGEVPGGGGSERAVCVQR